MNYSEKADVVAVVGPTASGKTRLGVSLAEKFSGEIISADSMQVYKSMDIATAKPSKDEMKGINHHLISFLSPEESFSVASFIKLANKAADDIEERNKLPIIVGGTGLYIDYFLSGISLLELARDEKVRSALYERLKSEGAEALLTELKKIDPQTAEMLHLNDTKRIIRALEVFMTTGKTLSQQNELSRSSPSKYNSLYIGLNYKDRKLLYERIDKRVDEMIKIGLLSEAESYFSKYKSETAKAAIGYKELKPFFDNEKTLDECVCSLKTATRRYAKRQITWFRRNESIRWFYIDDYTTMKELEEKVCETVRRWLDEKE
ncbi:MAG: tRNA (adenosine(37)-N6)-dimethylallyltransferase MiaA [Clostridiales bacterium]|jgi:tRNA dimethylallyltransferase|nr:tRNA (adenosine(37)-N6)-dimethylallyltransferase MiaA [Clostridiales bacterium]